MARVTVEDCVVVIPNRFELCLIAMNRAKSILSGVATTLDRKEKPAVISLREIAEKMINVETVRNNIMRNIRNKDSGIYNQSIINPEALEAIAEEVESQNLVLKDSIFSVDDVEIDD